MRPADQPDRRSPPSISRRVSRPEALAEASRRRRRPSGRPADLRELALVTIDGSDARDFDDAVWAAPDDDPDNQGGWHLVVAIADVGHYVTPGSALDREAGRRGNSVYFPDRVVPMLPEALSNDLCSLSAGETAPASPRISGSIATGASGGTVSSGRHALGGAADLHAVQAAHDAPTTARAGGPPERRRALRRLRRTRPGAPARER